MRFSAIAVLLTATFVGFGVALPGEEPFNRMPRSTPAPRPRPPRPAPPGPPPNRPLPPVPRPLPDAVAHHRQRDLLEVYNMVPRAQPDAIPPPRPPRPEPRPRPPRPGPPGPPPDRPLPPVPRPLPDALAHHRQKREAEPEYDFELYARDFGADLEELYERGLDGDFDLDERDLDEALELYERGFAEDMELYE
ncbi:hypothetical protein MMC11_002194 [Xylographa trunciseda]|nr:hypothetical protein [Xylographa trunciseda]